MRARSSLQCFVWVQCLAHLCCTRVCIPRVQVKLTCNLCPEWGLFNHARGIVRDIVYPGGVYDAKMTPTVWVQIGGYKGPSFFPDDVDAQRAQWVPISAVKKLCALDCCSRIGLPLTVAKADTVHSLQGLTIGVLQQIKRLRIRWSKSAEVNLVGMYEICFEGARVYVILTRRSTRCISTRCLVCGSVARAVCRRPCTRYARVLHGCLQV